MKIRKARKMISCDDGSAMSLFVVMMLCMTLLATASVTLTRTQYAWAGFSRQTSNSYHLARSGAEKIVDSMNKEVAKVLPDLMQKALDETHTKLMGTDGVQYKESGGPGANAYTGKYLGKEFENEYEIQLKQAIYNHIVDKFITNPVLADTDNDFGANKSDMKDTINIDVKTTIYDHHTLPPELEATVGPLVLPNKVGIDPENAFAVEVIAWAEEGAKSSLTKSRVAGAISLDQILKEEELIEEYEWDEVFPEVLHGAITSFGDFVLNDNSKATIEGNISVKGTSGPEPTALAAIEGNFPEPEEAGGIVISDGGKLKVKGSALVVNNIQTTNSKETPNQQTWIDIDDDAIAHTIAINDNYDAINNLAPWNTYVTQNEIKIGRNAFMDNDLRIDRYVKQGIITVDKSAFGISDGDPDGTIIGDKSYPDPNKASGIYAMGKYDDPSDYSRIKVGRAFIAGQAYINFGDGNGYHKLYESIGEPFEDVYYLEKYREAYLADPLAPVTGDDASYIDESSMDNFRELILRDKIIIDDKVGGIGKAYAPSHISADGQIYMSDVYDFISSSTEARNLFYLGLIGGFDTTRQGILTAESDWETTILGGPVSATNPTWGSIVADPLSYYTGENPFSKNYCEHASFNYGTMAAYKGLQAYMLAKRGVFYGGFEPTAGTTGFKPEAKTFADLVDIGVFAGVDHTWSRNNPIEIVSTTQPIDISQFKNMPTAIVCTNPSAVVTLKADGVQKSFTGIIITPGKLVIEDPITIHGPVIVGNENTGPSTKGEIIAGDYAGIQITATVGNGATFKYDGTNEIDRDRIFDIRFMDKSLQRKLYDCLKMTNYAGAESVAEEDRVDTIFGDKKVKLSEESVVSSKQDGLQFVMKSLKKIKD